MHYLVRGEYRAWDYDRGAVVWLGVLHPVPLSDFADLRLRHATQKLAGGDFRLALGEFASRQGRMSQFVRDFDLMAEQIEKLISAQSRSAERYFHELRSPLARLTVALELARQRTGSRAQSILDRIKSGTNRMNELIGSSLKYARLESGQECAEFQSSLKKCLEEIARDAAFEAQARNCQVQAEVIDDLPVLGDPARLHSAIENVVRNATRCTPTAPPLSPCRKGAEVGLAEAVIG